MERLKFKKEYLLLVVAIFILILFISNFLPPTLWRKDFYAGNLHTHTTCSDGRNSYDEMIDEAVRLGFKFIAITDHLICKENLEKCLNEKRILCLPGQEVTTVNGHVLAIDIKNAIPDFLFSLELETEAWHEIQRKSFYLEMPIEEVVEVIHKQGGIAIAAHPTLGIKESELGKINFEAMECGYGTYPHSKRARALSEKLGLPCVFNSDAHNKEGLKARYNLCKLEELSLEGVKEAIKNGRCQKWEPFWMILKFLNPEYWGIKVLKKSF